MKKRLFLFPALLAVLLLSGCTRELNGAGLALSFPEETVQFTGTVSKGTYTGAVTGDGWRFDGTLTAERLLTGEGENVPCRAALFGSVEDGAYTGSLVSGLPDGEGTFALSSGASFTGTFSGGAAVRGEYTKAKIAATASTSAAPEANLLCRERKPPNFPIIIVLSPLADIL